MKITSTIFGILCSSAVLFAQRNPERPEGMSEKEPVAVRDEQSSGSTSEAVAVINAIRTGVNAATKETNPKRVFTESDYQTLTTKADEFMVQRKYDDAILLYKEILKERVDPYAKDRMLEAEALLAAQQKEDELRKKDAVLAAKAEAVSRDKQDLHTVHFTGALMSDVSSSKEWTSEAFNRKDPYSDFLQTGKYDNLANDLKKSKDFSLDGIAIPANTRLIVYEKPNFTGNILLDVAGPAIVNNGWRVSDNKFKVLASKQFYDALQAVFPQSVRSWSTTNMNNWSGSMEIRTEYTE